MVISIDVSPSIVAQPYGVTNTLLLLPSIFFTSSVSPTVVPFARLFIIGPALASHQYILFTSIYPLEVTLVYGSNHPHGIVIFAAPPHISVAVTPEPSKFSIVNHVPIDDHSSATSTQLPPPDENWSAQYHHLPSHLY